VCRYECVKCQRSPRLDASSPEVRKKQKKTIAANGEEGENDLESLDWWTKYHASVETAIRVGCHGNIEVNSADVDYIIVEELYTASLTSHDATKQDCFAGLSCTTVFTSPDPTQFDKTALSSFVEPDCKSDHITSGDVITFTTRLENFSRICFRPVGAS